MTQNNSENLILSFGNEEIWKFRKIYYSDSITNNPNLELVSNKIQLLSKYGVILTQQMTKEIPNSKQKIDLLVLEKVLYSLTTHYVIDISIVSNGSSFSLGIMSKLLHTSNILVICDESKKLSVSSLIKSFFDIKYYNTLNKLKSIESILEEFFTIDSNKYELPSKYIEFDFTQLNFKNIAPNKKLIILLIGKPGSGKGTIGKNISLKYKIPHISTGELLRSIVTNPEKFNLNIDFINKIKKIMNSGELIDSITMSKILSNRLNQDDCINGFILDGYPHSFNNFMNVQFLNPDFVFYFECSDLIVSNRIINRNERESDRNIEIIQKRLDVFKKNVSLSIVQEWFKSKSIVVEINASNDLNNVKNQVETVIDFRFNIPTTQSYYPDNVIDKNYSTEYHMHIDAENNDDLYWFTLELLKNVPELAGRIKNYPISNLKLCDQTNNPIYDIYKKMMNFHKIENSSNESFSTIKLGNILEFQIVLEILNFTKKSEKKIMIEIEKYIMEKEFEVDFLNKKCISFTELSTVFYDDPKIDLKLKNFPLVGVIPNYELHFGLDFLKKDYVNKPFEIELFKKTCEKYDYEFGGIFMFENPTKWCYRTNEFSNLDNVKCIEKINHQYNSMIKVLSELSIEGKVFISYSIEAVHGIWQF